MVAALPSQDQSNHLWVCALPEFPSTAYCSSLLHWERELKHCGTYLILDPLLFHLVLFGLMLWEPSLTSGTPHPLCPQPQKQNQAAESPNTDWTTLHYPRIRYILLAAIYTQAIVVCFKIFKHLAILRRVQRASFFFAIALWTHFEPFCIPATASNFKQKTTCIICARCKWLDQLQFHWMISASRGALRKSCDWPWASACSHQHGRGFWSTLPMGASCPATIGIDYSVYFTVFMTYP